MGIVSRIVSAVFLALLGTCFVPVALSEARTLKAPSQGPNAGHIAVLKGNWLIEVGPVRLEAQFDDISRYHVGGPFTLTIAPGDDCSSVLSAAIRRFCSQARQGQARGFMTFDFRESEQHPPRHKGAFGQHEQSQNIAVIADMASRDLAWLRIGDGGRARMSRQK